MNEAASAFDPTLLDDCAREPIRIPGAIQPHGALLVLDPDNLSVLQASDNASEMLGAGGRLAQLADVPGGTALRPSLLTWLEGHEPTFTRTVRVGAKAFQISGHRTGQGLLLEFEEGEGTDIGTHGLHPRLQRFLEEIERVDDPLQLAVAAAREVRTLTGFGRVLIYRFDPEWHGTVIAEDGDDSLPRYLDLRFPAGDIPAQARELYRLNRLRLIPDADYQPVALSPPLSPRDGAPLDLSFAALRSVSPVHLEYMRNMGTAASMSVSLIVDGRLWGLISCHNVAPQRVDPRVRATCDFIGRILAMRIGARERADEAALRVAARRDEAVILERLGQASDLHRGFTMAPEPWLRLVSAGGVALLVGDRIASAGAVPGEAQILALAKWLHQKPEDIYATDRLAHEWPQAADFADVGSGVLAASISQIHASYAIWFRPEVVRTVRWAGDVQTGKSVRGARLHPRQSFASWSELVRLRAEPWRQAEIDTAADFRNAVVNFVLRQAEERAALSDELARSNKELEAFSYSVSHDLRAPFRHIVGFAQLLDERERDLDETSRHYVNAIIESALSAGRLVDDLLAFSQLSRAGMVTTRVDMNKLFAEVRRGAEMDTAGRKIEWNVARAPAAWGDAALLRQALTNLLSNALKYTRDCDPAVISFGGEEHSSETVYFLTDNGVGFDMAYVSKIFGVFQRLHRSEDFEGTGIGLALTKRVIDRHGGWIKAEGQIGKGARFEFGLPKRDKKVRRGG